jgi:hypothetical protein
MILNCTEISANELFHFTNNIDHIINIMLEGFKPFYCMEKLSYLDLKDRNGRHTEMAFPVVCFCDLPIHLQNSHRTEYGGYGIALDKTWGIDNALTPVVYTHENSISSAVLENLYNFWVNKYIQENEILAYKSSVSYLMMCFKPYEGYQYIKEEKRFANNTTRFYDEREWRYLPLKCDGLKLSLEKNEYKDTVKLKKNNADIQKNNHLSFNLSQLNSIYLAKHNEIDILLEAISKKYRPLELSQIKEKIIIV